MEDYTRNGDHLGVGVRIRGPGPVGGPEAALTPVAAPADQRLAAASPDPQQPGAAPDERLRSAAASPDLQRLMMMEAAEPGPPGTLAPLHAAVTMAIRSPGAPLSPIDLSKVAAPPLPRSVLASAGFLENHAVRPKLGFLARIAAWFGFRPKVSRAAFAAELGAALGALPRGAPLGPPVGVPALEPEVADATARLKAALRKVGQDAKALFGELESRSGVELAKIDRAFGLGHGGRWCSIRDALSSSLRGDDRRRALTMIENARAMLYRGDGGTLHDLEADPSGLFGPSGDGRLPQTIDKVLELRKRPPMSRADLVNRHEITAGNEVTLHPGGERAFQAVMRAIDAAESSVHISFFIYKDDEHGRMLTDKLIEKAKQGVKVRVTFDESGDMLAMSASARSLMNEMEAAGIEVACNYVVDGGRPTALLNSADHRKIVLVDGKVAFTGGMNIGTDYITEWQDHFMELRGPAVQQLQVEWMTNWIGLGRAFEPESSDAVVRERYFPPVETREGGSRVKIAQAIPGESTEIFRSYLQMIGRAQESIWIESPYITEPEIQAALLEARGRGVKVNVIIPGENNHSSCEHAARPALRDLVRAGGNVYAYDGMNHGKVMVIDRQWCIFGTANLDALSLRKVYEVNVHVDDRDVAKRMLAEIFLEDLGRSRKLTVEELGEAPLRERVWTALADFI